MHRTRKLRIVGVDEWAWRWGAPVCGTILVDLETTTVVRRLLDCGNTWVKLSGPYVTSKEGPPDYADVGKVASALVKAVPERLVWGSDWPHPTEKPDGKPDDGQLFDLLAEWAGDEATFKRILVDNPEQLYGFPQVKA